MFTLLGILAMLVGIAGGLLVFTGNANLLGPLSGLGIAVWAGVSVVGLVVAVMTRRPGD